MFGPDGNVTPNLGRPDHVSNAETKTSGNAVVRRLQAEKLKLEAKADRMAARLSEATNKRRETVRTLGGAAATLGSGSGVAALKAKFPKAMNLWGWNIPVDAIASGVLLSAAALGDEFLSDDSIAVLASVGSGAGTVFLADLIREALTTGGAPSASVAGWGDEEAFEVEENR
jgi:hypothetical protein